jgi:F-type H+-transporting ATPase subunit delta
MRTDRAIAEKAVELYANDLYQAAASDDSVNAADEALRALTAAVRGHASLRWALSDETIPGQAKYAVVRDLLGPDGHAAVASVVGLMAEMGHVGLLSEVSERFAEVAESDRGIAAVDVTTAIELPAQARERLIERLAGDLGKPVVLREHVDPSIVGGIVINRSGHVLDASVVSQLEHARLVLSTTTSGGEA